MPLIVTTRSSLPTGVDRQTVNVAGVVPTTVPGKVSSVAPPACVTLNSVGRACWRCSTVVVLGHHDPALLPILRRRRTVGAVGGRTQRDRRVALDRLAAGHLGAATRLFANPFSLADNVASLKFGTASATRTASTASAIISSTSVKPRGRRSPRGPLRNVLPCRPLVIVECPRLLVDVPVCQALGCSARPDGASAPCPRAASWDPPPMMKGIVVPSSSVTMPATGDGGRPPPTIVLRSRIRAVPAGGVRVVDVVDARRAEVRRACPAAGSWACAC